MKIGVIPYQKDDIVNNNSGHSGTRPRWPSMQDTHEVNAGHGDVLKFKKLEEVPLNRRNFIYIPCAANPSFTELGYCCTEYAFDKPGMSLMDRSDGISVAERRNDLVSVKENLGWRSSRCDVCIKEGKHYWEVEVLQGGLSDDYLIDSDTTLQRKKDMTNVMPHLRMGISRREASLEAPVGFNSYGYGIRDHSLESIHGGKINQVLKARTLKHGDRLGFLLNLPPLKVQIEQAKEFTQRRIDALNNVQDATAQDLSFATHEDHVHLRKKMKKNAANKEFQKALLHDIDHNNIIRDHIAIRYKNQLIFEATDYVKTTKPEYYSSDKRERHDYYKLEGSSLAITLNGEPLGKAFEGLKPFLPPFSELQYKEKFYLDCWKNGANSSVDSNSPTTSNQRQGTILRNKYVNNNKLGYYPTISCFNGGTARIITDRSNLKYFDESEKATLLDTLYDEQIAEDIVWDIIDEIEEESLVQLEKPLVNKI
ncbi:hypothetical protein HG535_0A05050 [Zygotorulaspora mrakii]|uniref:SPRY domain-containing protein n=1 Tax=Zygotorulaspora mrakii TaxID=42260 RepID=A0A7H9AWU0_ZYGMR|nr:uncharacterized protein HG535_0A05050 [Zygotorulaspora mrakii]QLG70564.1 hypothetical protein HG535_0A05050 [Zygotorulaspora mrakii]